MKPVLPVLVLSALVLAGCMGGGEQLAASFMSNGTLRVVDADGAPVPYAAVTLFAGGEVVARLSTGPDGALALPTLAADRVLVSATGFVPVEAAPSAEVVLLAGEDAATAGDPRPGLRMLAPYDFGTTYMGPPAACATRNSCGLSEAVVEVAGDGTIYASGTCCVGQAPPVWASRDGGSSWQELRTPGVREAVGIEGDFAIDDAGNLYFTDILLGAMWLTSWDKDGRWRHTVAVPFAPLVDRPWVRAGAENVVYFLYNTGFSTNFHVSTDGGRTFPPVPLKTFSAALGTLAQGPGRDDLWVAAGGKLYASEDGGRQWSAGETIPRPDKEGRGWSFAVPVVDEAGRVLVAYDWGTKDGYAVHAAIRDAEGEWTVRAVSALEGTHHMPWPAAGPTGGFVIAWYGTDDDAATPDTVDKDARWHVLLAATHDAGATWQTVRADPEPVALGPILRRLLDFLQVDVAPDGAAHVVYSRNTDGTNAERMLHARTTAGLGLAPLAFPHGPSAEASDALLALVRQAAGS